MGTAGHDDEQVDAHNWKRRCDLIYQARLSALYHIKRERFFDTIDKFCSAVTTVAATAAVGALLQRSAGYDLAAAILTAVLSMVPLVFNPAQKARHHGQLAGDFRRVLADCERVGQHWETARCDEFAARVMDLQTSEPAPLAALVADCQNQLAIASGNRPVADMRLRHHMLKHWIDVRPQPLN
jgi:hypothetical protein